MEIYTTNKIKRPLWERIGIYSLLTLILIGIPSGIAGILLGSINLHGWFDEPFIMPTAQTLEFGHIFPNGNYTQYYNINNNSTNEQYLNLSTVSFTNPNGLLFDLYANGVNLNAGNQYTTKLTIPPSSNSSIPITMYTHSDSPVGEFSILMNSTRI